MMGEQVNAAASGLFAKALLAILIVAGYRNLAHVKAALVGFAFASVFAVIRGNTHV